MYNKRQNMPIKDFSKNSFLFFIIKKRVVLDFYIFLYYNVDDYKDEYYILLEGVDEALWSDSRKEA
jgi:hypothetical protein